MRHRYFARMAQRAATLDRSLRIALVFASSATAGTVVGIVDVGPGLIAVLTALLAAVMGTLQLGAAAARYTGFAVEWGQIHEALALLWVEIERGAVSHDDVRDNILALEARHVTIDRQSITHRVNARVLSHCLDQAESYALAS